MWAEAAASCSTSSPSVGALRSSKTSKRASSLPGELALREAIPDLERRIWGTRRLLRKVLSWGAGDGASCAWHARIALARLGHERARGEILANLASWRRETREAAVVAAGRARMGEARGTLESLGGIGRRRAGS